MLPSGTVYSENLRQLEHILPIAFAFLLRFLTWPEALLLAFLAIVYGVFSSRIWRVTGRAGERGVSPGKVAYGVGVFCLILLFPDDEFIAAAVWANLSVGDAVSNLAGRNFGRRRLPWNAEKTWLGLASAFLASTPAAFVLIVWTGIPGGDTPPVTALWYAGATSLVCSLVETVRLPLDDNLAICAAGAAFLAWLSHASPAVPWSAARLAMGLGISGAAGIAALAARGVSFSGFLSGTVIGAAVYYGFGASGFVLLGTFFVLGTASSRLGYREKEKAGLAQAGGGRRSGRHVWGKGFAACVAALAAIFSSPDASLQLAFVTAVATASFDTVATELGQLYGAVPMLLTSLERVPRGTPGGVSPAGSILGLAAAAVVSGAGYGFGLVTAAGLLWTLLAATIAVHLESYLAARAPRARCGGPLMNAFHTTAAMLIALVFSAAF
jgi:uncharacterized protein (TIGR00297 family)